MLDQITPRQTLADNVRKCRDLRGWSKSELARRAGLHRADITRLESCANDLSYPKVIAIARAFDTSLDLLFSSSEELSEISA